jgi:HEAT repeat protein
MVRKLLGLAHQQTSELGSTASDTLAYVAGMQLTVDEIKQELESFDPTARARSAEILGLVGGDDAISELICLLQRDPSREVRLATVRVLARLHAGGAMEALRDAAQGDPDAEVRKAAQNTLDDSDRDAEALNVAEGASENDGRGTEARRAAEGATEDEEAEELSDDDAELAALVATWYEKEPD